MSRRVAILCFSSFLSTLSPQFPLANRQASQPMQCPKRSVSIASLASRSERVPPALQELVLSHFFRAARQQGGADDRCKLSQLPPLSLVSKQWAAWTKHHYALYPDINFTESEIDYDELASTIRRRRRGLACWCHNEGVVTIVVDNPEGKRFAGRQKCWKKVVEKVTKQFNTIEQLCIRFADDDSGECQELAYRFPREIPFLSSFSSRHSPDQ